MSENISLYCHMRAYFRKQMDGVPAEFSGELNSVALYQRINISEHQGEHLGFSKAIALL